MGEGQPRFICYQGGLTRAGLARELCGSDRVRRAPRVRPHILTHPSPFVEMASSEATLEKTITIIRQPRPQ